MNVMIALVFAVVAVLNTANATTSSVNSTTSSQEESTRHRRDIVQPTDQCYKQFFIDGKPPKDLPASNTIKYICQKMTGHSKTYFATEFDDSAGIAVFSAYKITAQQGLGIGKVNRVASWRQESGQTLNQGSTGMYAGYGTGLMGIHKGHLNPVKVNSYDQEHMDATFTYTNAVPQYAKFNIGPWKTEEMKIAAYVKDKCATRPGNSAVMYLLTGTSKFRLQVGAIVPTQDPAQPQIEYFPSNTAQPKIVRPNSMWTAGCCIWTDNTGAKAESLAVMGNNDYVLAKIQMTSLTLKQLEGILIPSGNTPADLFPGESLCRANSIIL